MGRFLDRRRLLFGGGAAAVALIASRGIANANQVVGATEGLAEVKSGTADRVEAQLRDSGRVVTVPTRGFPEDWQFQIGDLVVVRTDSATAGPLAAEPYWQVTMTEGQRQVWGFHATRGSRLVRTS